MANYFKDTRGLLARLRALPYGPRPSQRAHHALAERQAALLHYVAASSNASIERLIADQPSIRVQYAEIPTSGLSHWNGRQWIVTINASEPRTRQRFTLLHEFKHIIDHPDAAERYRDQSSSTSSEEMEQAADYFAGCALVPTSLLVDAWKGGMREATNLARHFDVSTPAIQVRLRQTGLVITKRCSMSQPRDQSSAAEKAPLREELCA